MLGKYIVDFLAPALRFAVEVDGGYLARKSRAACPQECSARGVGLPRPASGG